VWVPCSINTGRRPRARGGGAGPGAAPPHDPAIWRHADVLHVPDGLVWQHLLAEGCPPDKPRVSYPMPVVHPDFLQTHRDGARRGPSSPLRVLSVSPLTWMQGYEWALQAVALAHEGGTPCEYRILGQGEHLEALSFARYQLGLDGQVELGPPPANRGELLAGLGWADVYLDAPVARWTSGSVAEALAMAVPVLATDRTELAGEPIDRAAALVVPRRDPAAMAEKLALLHSDPELRRSAGAAGRSALLGRFTLDDHVAELDRAYREVLG
jgi:glycosyltransferase involved in cell wall biosynthesis